MGDKLKISHKICDKIDLNKLINLGKTYYDANSLSIKPEFLNWLYLENHFGVAELVVIEDEALLVGVIALIPILLSVNNGVQECFFAVNVLTHPSYRGKNFFGRMIEEAKKQLKSRGAWLIGHPNANAIPGWRKSGMQFRDQLMLYINKPNFINLFKLKRVAVDEPRKILEIENFFWDSINTGLDAHVNYTPEFVIWRFFSVIGKNYTITAVYDGSVLLGLVITKKYKFCVDLLIDVIASPGATGKVISSLVKPTLIFSPSIGSFYSSISKNILKLPINKSLPFFVSTWDESLSKCDFSRVTFAASDL